VSVADVRPAAAQALADIFGLTFDPLPAAEARELAAPLTV
jgi:hypothetical protein